MASGEKWTWEEELAAWALYMVLPTRCFVAHDPHVKTLALALGRTGNSVKMKLWNIAAHDQQRVDEGKRSLRNGSALDQRVWEEFARKGDALLEEAVPLLEAALRRGASMGGAAPSALPRRASTQARQDYAVAELPIGLEREVTKTERVNQSYFRNRLMENYGERCCLTGLGVERLLVASHIKPWKDADPATERLAPDNGLLLNSLHDRAFDQGLITLDSGLRVVVSPLVPKNDDAASAFLWAYEGRQITAPKAFPPRKEFLEYHNDVVFKRSA